MKTGIPKPSPIFRNAKGELLEAGKWYNFGGNVSVRFTAHGKMGKRYWTRLDTTGEAKPVGGGRPAARDAVEGALYNSVCPVGYAAYRYGAAFVAPGEETPAQHAAAEKVLDKAFGGVKVPRKARDVHPEQFPADEDPTCVLCEMGEPHDDH